MHVVMLALCNFRPVELRSTLKLKASNQASTASMFTNSETLPTVASLLAPISTPWARNTADPIQLNAMLAI